MPCNKGNIGSRRRHAYKNFTASVSVEDLQKKVKSVDERLNNLTEFLQDQSNLTNEEFKQVKLSYDKTVKDIKIIEEKRELVKFPVTSAVKLANIDKITATFESRLKDISNKIRALTNARTKDDSLGK